VEIKTRNVNTAFKTLVQLFHSEEYCGDVWPWEVHGRKASVVAKSPRGMATRMVGEPVTVAYDQPTERVLFNSARDANPFFHLYHALWLLAGRDDVAAPAYYVWRYAEFSDDGVTSNGSYGRRWRHSGAGDQLELVVRHLRDKPDSRRAVIQMWTAEDDLVRADTSRDVCCNLCVLPVLRETPEGRVLDVTVMNRSNDLVWGLLGEDVVTFSVLQEYLAAKLGAGVGLYHHVTNNLHVYDSNWRPNEWLADETPEPGPRRVPLVEDPVAFDTQLPFVVSHFDGREVGSIGADEITEPFLWDVVRPLLRAYSMHRQRRTGDAIGLVTDQCEADDWRLVAVQWLRRRLK